MNVGLPGTGIGGLFYLVTALLMPVFELVRFFRGQSSVERWKVVGEQWLLAVGILAGLWTTSLILKIVFPSIALHQHGRAVSVTGSHLFGVTPTGFTLGTMAVILFAAELPALFFWGKKNSSG